MGNKNKKMSKNSLTLQILLNITFIIMLTCSEKLFLSNRNKMKKSMNATITQGSFQINNQNINNTIAKVENALNNTDANTIPLPLANIPHGNFTGNGTYEFTKKPNGTSFEISVQETEAPKHIKNMETESHSHFTMTSSSSSSNSSRTFTHLDNHMKNIQKKFNEIKAEMKNSTNPINATNLINAISHANSFLEIEPSHIFA